MQTSYNQQIAAIKRALAISASGSITHTALIDAITTITAKKEEVESKQLGRGEEIENDLPENFE